MLRRRQLLQQQSTACKVTQKQEPRYRKQTNQWYVSFGGSLLPGD